MKEVRFMRYLRDHARLIYICLIVYAISIPFFQGLFGGYFEMFPQILNQVTFILFSSIWEIEKDPITPLCILGIILLVLEPLLIWNAARKSRSKISNGFRYLFVLYIAADILLGLKMPELGYRPANGGVWYPILHVLLDLFLAFIVILQTLPLRISNGFNSNS